MREVLAVEADANGDGIPRAVSDLMLHENVHVQRPAAHAGLRFR